MNIDKKVLRQKRAEAQQLDATVHVGKNGITEATIQELDAQLKKNKLVKVRMLPAATEGGANDKSQAVALQEATHSYLIDQRGHTAVYFRG